MFGAHLSLRDLLLVALASGVTAYVAVSFVPANVPFGTSAPACNVLGVNVHGAIVANSASISGNAPSSPALPPGEVPPDQVAGAYAISRDIENLLRDAALDPNIKAVIVDVDSSGGGPVAGEEIAAAIRRTGKPTAAIIRELGLSSGYLAAAGAETIFASESSVVGGIGVTISYLDFSEKNRREGVIYQELSSGPFKNTLDPHKALTSAERALILRDVKLAAENFESQVAFYRGLPKEKVAALADGSTMLGKQALENGLIDRLGGLSEAIGFIEEKIGEPASLCWQ